MTDRPAHDAERTGAESTGDERLGNGGTVSGFREEPFTNGTPEMDFNGWDRERWREFRRAQKKAYKEARWQEKTRQWETHIHHGDEDAYQWDPDEWESHWHENAESDPLGALTWAAIFVWAGLVMLAGNLGFLNIWIASLGLSAHIVERFSLGAYSIVFLGVALILFVQVALRLLVPAFYKPVIGSLVLGSILLGVGLDGLITWNIVWPVILILLGAYIILGGALRR